MPSSTPSGSSPVSRRTFVGASVAGLATAVGLDALPLHAAPAPAAEPPHTQPFAVAPFAVAPFELEDMTIAELQHGMASGRFTARRLCEAYLERIHALNARGPTLRAVLQTNPDALAIADRLDAERRAGKVRGPMHGIPILIKDNIDTHDRMTTAAGSLALARSIAPRDSFVAERLRAAGAVILGKANLSEWANYRSTHSTSGWSGMGGQTRNPYALDRTPSGSSSGSGAAAAASLCAVAIGTETNGSVVSPSSAQSIVGIKPTVGLVSRSGIIPISHSQDTAGPMGRTVADAATLLGVLTGVDPRDEATSQSSGHAVTDYTRFLDPNGLRGARIGVVRERLMGYNKRVDAIIDGALDVMKRAGATIVDPANLETIRTMGAGEGDLLRYEFKHDIDAYLASLGPDAPVRTLADLIEWNRAHAREEMPYFGQEIFEMAQAMGPLTDKAYLDVLEKTHRLTRDEGIDATIRKYNLDALVAPTQGTPGLIDLVNGDAGNGGGSASSPAAMAGYPHITVPAGYIYGLPVGISFFGGAWTEPTLIKLAYAYEQLTHARKPPKFLPTALLTPVEPL